MIPYDEILCISIYIDNINNYNHESMSMKESEEFSTTVHATWALCL